MFYPFKLLSEKQVDNTRLSYSEFLNPIQLHSNTDRLNQFRILLKETQTLNEILTETGPFFPSDKQYLFVRIKELGEMFDEDEDSQISVDSLKSMLIFLFSLNEFARPRLTLNENGTFQAGWRKNNNILITLRFKEDEFLDYVIFRPSNHIKKPIIFNGNMNIFDFKDNLRNLLDMHIDILKELS